VTVLAAVLGLPVVAAGLILSNSCQLNGSQCSGRLAFGLIGGIVLAAGVQLLLALHVRLGWSFWVCSVLVMATALIQSSALLLILILLIAPGIAAWVTDPPHRRASAMGHWTPRLLVLTGLLAGAGLLGLLS
jgi:hypothetical protein